MRSGQEEGECSHGREKESYPVDQFSRTGKEAHTLGGTRHACFEEGA